MSFFDSFRSVVSLVCGVCESGICDLLIRSTQCCLWLWSRWVEPSTRLGGFRAHKKTPKVPYTTKVNYHKHTSRGRYPTVVKSVVIIQLYQGVTWTSAIFPPIYTPYTRQIRPDPGLRQGLPTCATKRGPQPPRACRLPEYGVLL